MNIFIVITILFMTIWGYLVFVYQYHPKYLRSGYFYYDSTYNMCYYFMCLCVIILTFGRYWWFGGPDTHNYVSYFQGIEGSYYYVIHPINDIAFVFVSKMCRLVSTNEQIIIVFLSLFTLIPILWGIEKCSGDRILSIIFFVSCTTRIWLTSMAAERQFFSISAIVISIIFIQSEIKGKYIYFVLSLIVSCLFHLASIAPACILILVFIKNVNKSSLYFLLIFTWMMSGFHQAYDRVLSLFNYFFISLSDWVNPFEGYINDDNFTLVSILSTLPINLFAFINLYFASQKDKNYPLINFFVIGICLFNLLSSHAIGVRMVHVFFVVGCLAIPHLLKKRDRIIYIQISFLLMLVMSWRMIVSYLQDSRYYLENPWYSYKFFFE